MLTAPTPVPQTCTVRLDAAHRYWCGDRELDGCTRTLTAVGLRDTQHFTDEACARGTYVHDMLRLDLEADLLESSVEPAYLGYLIAARAYLAANRFDVLRVETPLGDAVRLIGGTPDLLAKRGTRFVVVDWKTGAKARWHGYQLAWYEHLARVNGLITGVVEREAVYLDAGGTFTVQPYADRNDWQVAQAAIIVAQAQRRQ